MSFENFASICSGLGVVLVVILVQWSSYKIRKQATETAHQVSSVHSLVNSAMGKVLRQAVFLTQRIASLTGEDRDHKVAQEARQDLMEYEKNYARDEMIKNRNIARTLSEMENKQLEESKSGVKP